MKNTTRILALLLALVLTLGLSATAFADEVHAGNNGTITIDNAIKDQTYTIYEILYLESYNDDSGAYSYKATAAWSNFINSNAVNGTYVEVDGQGYVTWKGTKEDSRIAAFAKLAQAYAANPANSVTATKKETATATSTTVTFTGLDLGYYLLDSSLGTLCSLNTTKPDVTIKEKNVEPTNEKQVEEDSNKLYGSVNDADIGQTVNFKSTITAQAGAENYVFHDKMSAGLTYTGVTGITLNGATVDKSNYEVNTTSLTDGCTFEVVFTQAFCDNLKAGNQIVISYTATVNESAEIGGNGNPNESHISYGENGQYKSTPSETKTFTWKIDVFKFYQKENQKLGRAGAKFTLSKNENGLPAISLIKVENNVYRLAKEGESGTVTEIISDDTGRFTIKGLDSDTYFLTETEAPQGFNKLAAPVKVVIDKDGKVNATVDNPNGVTDIEIENKSGTQLPSTGGVGTTVFYVLGGILAVGAAVLLIARKRAERA